MKPPADRVNAISIHEAAHAVVALALRRSVGAVTIVRDGHVGGFAETVFRRSSVRMFRELPDGSWVSNIEQAGARLDQRRARDVVVICLAGAEAERQIVPDLLMPDGNEGDREIIAEQLANAVNPGESPDELLTRLQDRTAMLVRRHRNSIITLAAYLVANETLTGAQVRLFWRYHRNPAPLRPTSGGV